MARPLQQSDRLLDRVPVLALARVVAQVLELELHGTVLGEDRRRLRPARVGARARRRERDGGARQPGGRVAVERVHQLVGELLQERAVDDVSVVGVEGVEVVLLAVAALHLRLRQEDFLLRELEGGEQPAEDADDGLEHRDALER